MKIQTGFPASTGFYVCYMPGVEIPTVVRFWIDSERRWMNKIKEPVAGDVAGWIGPLPIMGETDKLEFDL